MRSKASVKGHPIHPMFVVFPLALFTVGLASLIAFTANGDGFWFHVAYLAMVIGGLLGLVAALFGLVDAFALPRDSRAKKAAIVHGAFTFSATALFFGAGMAMLVESANTAPHAELEVGFPLVLSIVGFVLLMIGGALGWQLVGAHHVGVSPVPGHAGPVKLAGHLEREPPRFEPPRTPAHTGARP
jgi:uncharacterized membrane protein